jgi:hypothetical protein
MSVGGDVSGDFACRVIATGSNIGAEEAAHIAAGMQGCPNITSLNFWSKDVYVLCCYCWQ